MQRSRIRNIGRIESLYNPLSFLIGLSGCHLENRGRLLKYYPSLHCFTGESCLLISESGLHFVKDESWTIQQDKENQLFTDSNITVIVNLF